MFFPDVFVRIFLSQLLQQRDEFEIVQFGLSAGQLFDFGICRIQRLVVAGVGEFLFLRAQKRWHFQRTDFEIQSRTMHAITHDAAKKILFPRNTPDQSRRDIFKVIKLVNVRGGFAGHSRPCQARADRSDVKRLACCRPANPVARQSGRKHGNERGIVVRRHATVREHMRFPGQFDFFRREKIWRCGAGPQQLPERKVKIALKISCSVLQHAKVELCGGIIRDRPGAARGTIARDDQQ